MNTFNQCTLFVFILLTCNPFAQNDSAPKPDFGNCYAKCITPIQYEEITETFDVLIGEKKSGTELDSIYFEMENGTEDLIYLGALSNLTKVQRKQLEDYVVLVFVKDAVDWDEIGKETLTYKEEVGGGEKQWVEVLCESDMKPPMIDNVEAFLIENLYMDESLAVGRITDVLEEALYAYQKNNDLPVGNFNIATIKAMGLY